MALLLKPFKLSQIENIPLTIDFTLVTGNKDHEGFTKANNEKFEQTSQLQHLSQLESYAENSIDQIVEKEILPDPINERNHISNESHANFEQHQHPKFTQPYITSAFIPPNLHFPRIDIAEPKLFPAKMPLTETQENKLLKEIKKLAENFHKLDWPDTTIIIEDKKQTFEVRIRRHVTGAATELDEITFEITTEEHGRKLSTSMRMRRMAFSNFAQFVDYWDPKVAVHDDEVEGRFHSNYAFTISHSKGIGPKFHGKVTTASYDVKTSNDFPIINGESIFIGGIETGVKQIYFPKTFSPFPSQSEIDQNQVHQLTEETWITFHKNGSYSWESKSSTGREYRKNFNNKQYFFFVGNKGGKIHVKGRVKGTVLVYSADNIIIDGNLIYAQPPNKFQNSEDYLGLVSEKNIEVAHPSITGPGDLHIYAALYAKRQFRIPHLWSHGKATLYIYGSLTAGSLSATEPRYATRIRFDKRLETYRPPNFPLTERYELVDWEKEWEVKDH